MQSVEKQSNNYIFEPQFSCMITKEEAFAKILELVERFMEQIDSYKRSDYNETNTRQDFINPFFKAATRQAPAV